MKSINLEKNPTADIMYCDFIADYVNEEENIRTRILYDKHYSKKYYYHQMKDGEVIKFFEIAFAWKPFDDCYVFRYTPDNLHVYEIDSRFPEKMEILRLQPKQIKPGMECTYNGLTVKYESGNSLNFNGKSIKVVSDSRYTYKLLKTKIKAQGGAKGLYSFLENIAETGKFKVPLFHTWWNVFLKQYGI